MQAEPILKLAQFLQKEILGYHVKGLHGHKRTRTSTEIHQAALAVGSQACSSQILRLKNMTGTPPIASSSTNPTLCQASPPPKTLNSTTSRPFVHLHHTKSIQKKQSTTDQEKLRKKCTNNKTPGAISCFINYLK